jgi:hypothetical protein
MGTVKAFAAFWFALISHSDRNSQNQNKGLSNFLQEKKNISGRWVYLGLVRSPETNIYFFFFLALI